MLNQKVPGLSSIGISLQDSKKYSMRELIMVSMMLTIH